MGCGKDGARLRDHPVCGVFLAFSAGSKRSEQLPEPANIRKWNEPEQPLLRLIF